MFGSKESFSKQRSYLRSCPDEALFFRAMSKSMVLVPTYVSLLNHSSLGNRQATTCAVITASLLPSLPILFVSSQSRRTALVLLPQEFVHYRSGIILQQQ